VTPVDEPDLVIAEAAQTVNGVSRRLDSMGLRHAISLTHSIQFSRINVPIPVN